MKVQCSHCDKKYTLPVERIAGRILKIRCRQCSELFEVDGSQINLSQEIAIEQKQPIDSLSDQAVALKTQEFSAIDPEQLNAVQATFSQEEVLKQANESQAISAEPKQSNSGLFSIEVSQSAQEWMESVMSDVDRPITQEIRHEEITGLSTLPPESSSPKLIWLALGLIIFGFGYLLLQLNDSSRPTQKVVSISLKAEKELTSETLNVQPEQKEDVKSTLSAESAVNLTGNHDVQKEELNPNSLKSEMDQAHVKVDQSDSMNSLNSVDPTVVDNKVAKQLEHTKPKQAQPIQSKKRQVTKVTTATKPKNLPKKTEKRAPNKRTTKPKTQKQTVKRVSKKRSTGKGLSRSTISTVMNQNASGLQHCYQKALKKDSSFGEVRTRLSFTVNPNGRVDRNTISLSGVYRKTRLESCIQNTVVRWYFPQAEGDTPVKYPLNFSPGF